MVGVQGINIMTYTFKDDVKQASNDQQTVQREVYCKCGEPVMWWWWNKRRVEPMEHCEDCNEREEVIGAEMANMLSK